MIGGSSRLVVSDTILDGLQTNFEPTIDAIVKYSWFKTTDSSLKEENRQRLIDAGPEVVYNDFLACSRFDLSKRLNEVDVPALVIASNDDRMVPSDVSRKMADAIKDARFVGSGKTADTTSIWNRRVGWPTNCQSFWPQNSRG